ncbi:ATP-grasp domain-containing protein [Chryseobacterium aquaticum]|uniref:ATP-grasp domain-containing protein n=1 Tax=Chryseobacterium aquaticum TaxID=452084 RepID=A0A848N8H5_9FLAO|nr:MULTISPECIES: ATP-grasp domain-containing protein [Chryseobacterium]NMR35774.1 ATP-grasp domain-containing protein [Chryseobacterium aquaticum]NRQ47779.1 ATP-grasp domain-containing protein [Chryseobacterium sp. C-204]
MSNILITSAGQRVSLVKAFQKEIINVNSESKIYTVDLNPILAPACHVSDGFRKVKKVDDPNYISDLITICKELSIDVIIPTIDTELLVLAENKQLFLKEGVIPIVSELDFVKACRDKRIINDFFEKNRIEVPKTIDKNNLTFPVFIKPYDGSLSKDIFLIKDYSELTNFHFSNPKLMFMEYIDHAEHDEYTVDTYYDKNGNLKCIVPRKRILVRAGEINKGVTHKNEIMDYVKERLAHIDGAVGCLTIQFFYNNKTKRIIGIEINPRFGGGYPLSYLAGANYPKFIIEEYILGKKIEYFDGWESNLLMLRYDNEVLVRNYEE